MKSQPVPKEGKSFTIAGIFKCARCRGNHNRRFLVKPLANWKDNGVPFTHWCMCPKLKQPIFVKILK